MTTHINVPEVKILGIPGIPIVEKGDDLVAMILRCRHWPPN